MDPTTAGATPAAESSASTATPNVSAPPASTPRTTADIAKRISEQLRSSGQPTEPAKATTPDPTPASAQESPAGETESDEAQPALSNSNDETTDNAEAETHDARETDAEPESKQWPKSAIERTKKLKAQRAELRNQVEQLKQRERELQAQIEIGGTRDTPKGEKDPYEGISDPQAINQLADQARSVSERMRTLIEDLTHDPERVEQRLRAMGANLGSDPEAWTPQKMRDYMREVRDKANAAVESAPRRINHVQQEQQAIQRVLQVVPDLQDEDSQLHRTVQEVLKAYPALRSRPDWLEQYTIYSLGLHQFQEMAKGAKAPAAKPAAKPLPKAPAAVSVPRVAPVPPEKPGELEQARANLKGSKGLDGFLKYASAAVKASMQA